MSVIFRMEAPYRGHYELHRLTFGSGSPTIAIVAGLHGNELNGMHAVNLLASSLRFLRPKGTVHLFPLVNTFGADEARKRWPLDDRDINRAFPGRPDGTAVQRIAHALMEATDAEVCVDVHSGAPHVRELPQVRVPLSGDELGLARSMGLPVVWRRPGAGLSGVGLIGAWRNAGRKALHVVVGRGITLDTSLAGVAAQGLTGLLAHLGIIGMAPEGRTVADVTRLSSKRHHCPLTFANAK